jgi:hypothetical protein
MALSPLYPVAIINPGNCRNAYRKHGQGNHTKICKKREEKRLQQFEDFSEELYCFVYYTLCDFSA